MMETLEDMIDNDIPGSTIILALISVTMIWTLVYFISFMIRPNKSAEWHSLMVCLIHGIVNTYVSYMVQMRKDSWPLNHPGKSYTLTLLHVKQDKETDILCYDL